MVQGVKHETAAAQPAAKVPPSDLKTTVKDPSEALEVTTPLDPPVLFGSVEPDNELLQDPAGHVVALEPTPKPELIKVADVLLPS